MIEFAESVKIQPIDRDYYKHNTQRKIHFEIFGNGICHCITSMQQHIPYILFIEANRTNILYDDYKDCG